MQTCIVLMLNPGEYRQSLLLIQRPCHHDSCFPASASPWTTCPPCPRWRRAPGPRCPWYTTPPSTPPSPAPPPWPAPPPPSPPSSQSTWGPALRAAAAVTRRLSRGQVGPGHAEHCWHVTRDTGHSCNVATCTVDIILFQRRPAPAAPSWYILMQTSLIIPKTHTWMKFMPR